ncbi:MAG: DNA methyltransferase [Ahrensia sp.]|nr:DNA methyltransferase [Ahrensia sp.]
MMTSCHITYVGPHRLILGDAYEVLPGIGRFDAIVMDPPYRFKASGGGKFRKARGHTDAIMRDDLDLGFDLAILSWRSAGTIVCFCHNDQVISVGSRLKEGFHRIALCQWHKENPMPVANKHYLPDTEFYWHAWQRGYAPIGELANKRRYITTPVGKSPYDHPPVKPDAVMDKVMANVAGVSVCDPFMGTGSTGVAAIKAGRIFTGIEREEKYFEIACERVQQLVGDLR